METAAVRALAARHGLDLRGELDVNELGLDYQVVTGDDAAGVRWVLRIPRRDDVRAKVAREAGFLRAIAAHVPFAVPDWRVATPDLVAYPMLTDTTAMVMTDAGPAFEVDLASHAFTDGLAPQLAAFHAMPVAAAAAAGMPVKTPAEARAAVAADVERVRAELGVAPALYDRWRRWLADDTSWPGFCTPVHGDLYVGHVLVDAQERVTGVIDWSEARVDDPAIDFTAHLMVFGAAGLDRLIAGYAAAGGRTWPRMAHHVAERLAIAPVLYALFGLVSGDPTHLAAARAQLLDGSRA